MNQPQPLLSTPDAPTKNAGGATTTPVSASGSDFGNRKSAAEDFSATGEPRPAGMRVVPLTPELAGAWDAFVTQSPQGLPQHLAGWRDVLAGTYGYKTFFVMATTESPITGKYGSLPAKPEVPEVRGVLPLFLIDTPLAGRTLTTTPGGLCAADEDAAAELLAHARHLAHSLGAKAVVLQDSRSVHAGLHATTLHEARLLDLSAGEDAVWQGLDRNVRRQVRMAERNEVTVEIDRTGARLDDFYAVMSRFTHLVGTPIFPRRFLEEVVDAFPKGIHLAMAYHQGQPVGGYFQLALGTTLYGAWGATLPDALSLRTVYASYWAIMADAIQNGFTCLDMGRSPTDSSAANYKAQWGGMTVPVYQQAWRPGGGNGATLSTRAQQDGRLLLVRRLWPRLPFGVAQWLGPQIRRYVPFG